MGGLVASTKSIFGFGPLSAETIAMDVVEEAKSVDLATTKEFVHEKQFAEDAKDEALTAKALANFVANGDRYWITVNNFLNELDGVKLESLSDYERDFLGRVRDSLADAVLRGVK